MDWGWRKRLEASFFLRLSETGPDGRTELLSPLSASNMFEVSPMAGLCGGNNLSPSLDKENLIVLTPACSVKGRVVDADNKVVANSYVGFMGARQGQEVFLTSTPVDQEGNYSIAVVPANFDQLQAIGFAEGYTLSYQTIARPQAGGNYQHDFVIHKAVALACYLHADGEPVANAEVFFAVDELEDVPGFYRTDKNGNLTTDRVFRANTQYQLQLVSGSARLGVYPFTIPENQQEVLEIEVDPVGTLVLLNASTDSDEQIVACRFRSQSGHAVGFTEWDPRQGGGPLVPVGQGRLVCRTAGGSSWSKDLNVRSGVNQIQTIIRQAPLTFTLPETEDVGNWKIGFYTDGDTPDRSVELLSGQHEVQVSPGSISFQIESPDGNSWQLGPVAVREDGFDLGVLAPQAGTIIGRVVDENGQAWAGLQVSLVDVDMRPEARAFSDAEGRFAFNQIPFGFHSVHLRPRRSLLLNSPDQHLDVHVTNGAPVEIEMVVQADSSLRGKVIPAPQKPTEVWAINANTVQEQSLSPSGDFAFSTMAAGWVLAGRFEEGKVFLVGEKVNGDQELLLDFSSCEELNLDFADVSGKPAAFARVQFEVVGSQLAGSASLNEHGQLSLSYSPALPLVLVVNTNNYGKVRYPLAKLIQGSKLTLDGKAATLHPVVVRTLDGNMLNYATISNRSLREVWHTNNAGTCLLPENSFSDELRFEYSGYWTHILRQISQTVVMRKTIAPIEITYPGSISVDEVVLIPVFDLGYEFPLNVSPTAARTWQISGIPEGRYVISALDRAGVIVDQREEKLSSQTGHNIVVR